MSNQIGGVLFEDELHTRVVFFARQPRDLQRECRLDAATVIDGHPVAEPIKHLVNRIPKVATLMDDLDPALGDAAKRRDVALSRLAVDADTLDEDRPPSDV
jgi:hypothetical protein